MSRLRLLNKWCFKTKIWVCWCSYAYCVLPLQVAFLQAVRHGLSGGILSCFVVLGHQGTIVCTEAERSSLQCRWERRRFPLCFQQMQQGCRCDGISLSLNVCPFIALMTWYILYLYDFILIKSCLSLSLESSGGWHDSGGLVCPIIKAQHQICAREYMICSGIMFT